VAAITKTPSNTWKAIIRKRGWPTTIKTYRTKRDADDWASSTEAQRGVLNRARRLAGLGSLIPSNRNYVQQMRIYEGNTLRAGHSRMHGLRHAYAQNRYEELTGWKCPAVGGPESKSLTPEQRETDCEARLTISKELGHDREAVTAVYLGK